MSAQLLAGQRNKHPALPILPILLVLDTFALGGFAAFLVVNRLLNEQLALYVPRHMDAASAILDLMDDLIPYVMVCSAALLVLVLSTICVTLWHRASSQVLRYGTLLLVLLLVAAGVWIWVSRTGTAPAVLPVTPTPVAHGFSAA